MKSIRNINSKFIPILKARTATLLQPLNFRLSRYATHYIETEISTLREAYLSLAKDKVFVENLTIVTPKKPFKLISSTPRERVRLAHALKIEGSDKSTRHSYSDIYSDILMSLGARPTIVEVGIGSSTPSSIGFMGKGYKAGASLRAWQSFLPNARIIGADIDESTLLPQKGIELKYLDQTNKNSLIQFSNFLGPESCDLIIDDGLHNPLAGLKTFEALWPCLKPGGFYVIEDMSAPLVHFYNDLGYIFSDITHKFFDLSKERSRVTN